MKSKRIAKLAIIAATALVLAGLYIGARYLVSSEVVAATNAVTYRLDIKERSTGVDAPIFRAREGDRITLTVTSAQPGEFYIHGLEVRAKLTPGSETKVSFNADRSGRYYIHLHGSDHSHTEEAVIEVAPR